MDQKNLELKEIYAQAVNNQQKGNFETDKIDFKDGYESRRMNITYLFGTRQIKKTNIL